MTKPVERQLQKGYIQSHPYPGAGLPAIWREKLAIRVKEIEAAKLTLVTGPAGSGKSWQMAQWQQSLEARALPVAAFRALSPRRAQETKREGLLVCSEPIGTNQRLAHEVPGDEVTGVQLAGYIREQCKYSSDCLFVFIDDAHNLTDTGNIAWLESLLEAERRNLHIVVATRRPAILPLARLRMSGELVEIGPHELRFDRNEANALFRLGRDHLDEYVNIDTLVARCRGWAAGLRLADMASRSAADPGAILTEFSGDWKTVRDFITEEVLTRESNDIQRFLIHTSVLRRLNGPLCDALLAGWAQPNVGARLLEESLARGLFLEAVDDQGNWFEYNPLFADALQRQLRDSSPQAYRELHRKAALTLIQHGRPVEAFEVAVRGEDFALAADVMDAMSDDLYHSGEEQVVLALADQLPPKIQREHPRIMLAISWLHTALWRLDNSSDLIKASRTKIDAMADDASCDPAEVATLRRLLLHREMKLAQVQDDMPTVESQAVALLRDPDLVDGHLKASVYGSLLFARREQFKLNDIDRLQLQAHEQLRSSDSVLIRAFLEAIVGPSYFSVGRLDAAIRSLEAGIEAGTLFGGIHSAHAAICKTSLAEVLYECNEIERCSQLLEPLSPEACCLGFVDQFIANWTTRSRLSALRGDTEGAFRHIDVGTDFANAHNLERLRLVLVGERLKLLKQTGQTLEAVGAGTLLELSVVPSKVTPTQFSTTREEARAFAWLLMAEMQGRYADARTVADRWRSFAAAAGAVRSAIRWSLAVSRLLNLIGDVNGAQKALLSALTLAAPGCHRRSFLDEGNWIDPLLISLCGKANETNDVSTKFGKQILESIQKERQSLNLNEVLSEEDWQGLASPLAPRELEILRMVASGLLNREIGDRLAITEGSVKWYLQQIYDKFGTRRRYRAVERARHLGLLNS
ncbi:LuxR C-terminal-related transcriptional regulator (plasmid) [Agrobacterium leguminum]|uniref:LuxR C-terminal-related transcriptional regulator n=1 Tax=Agrobacterium leguminum TaxID=2792015 RepID=UPI0030D4B27D